jgi:hypothetical protein
MISLIFDCNGFLGAMYDYYIEYYTVRIKWMQAGSEYGEGFAIVAKTRKQKICEGQRRFME